MQGPAHLGTSWLLGERAGLIARRDRRIVGLAGLLPDADVIIYPLAFVFFLGDIDAAFAIYADVHHRYTHGIGFALLTTFAAYRLATAASRMKVALLAGFAVVLHVACDVIAAGTEWPVYPWWPLDPAPFTVSWSWPVSDWRNVALTFAAIAMTLIYARQRRYSPVECFSYRADNWVGEVMHGRVRSSPRFRVIVYTTLVVVTTAIVLPLWLYLR